MVGQMAQRFIQFGGRLHLKESAWRYIREKKTSHQTLALNVRQN